MKSKAIMSKAEFLEYLDEGSEEMDAMFESILVECDYSEFDHFPESLEIRLTGYFYHLKNQIKANQPTILVKSILNLLELPHTHYNRNWILEKATSNTGFRDLTTDVDHKIDRLDLTPEKLRSQFQSHIQWRDYHPANTITLRRELCTLLGLRPTAQNLIYCDLFNKGKIDFEKFKSAAFAEYNERTDELELKAQEILDRECEELNASIVLLETSPGFEQEMRSFFKTRKCQVIRVDQILGSNLEQLAKADLVMASESGFSKLLDDDAVHLSLLARAPIIMKDEQTVHVLEAEYFLTRLRQD